LSYSVVKTREHTACQFFLRVTFRPVPFLQLVFVRKTGEESEGYTPCIKLLHTTRRKEGREHTPCTRMPHITRRKKRRRLRASRCPTPNEGNRGVHSVLQDASYRTEERDGYAPCTDMTYTTRRKDTVHRNVSYNTEEERGTLRKSVCLIQQGRRREIHSVHQDASYNTEEVRAHCRDSPLSYNSHICNSAILVCVMSLWDARNRTTSRFSFLMGTMSRRHQNGVPETEDQNVLTL
jgi:hypothetical protein